MKNGNNNNNKNNNINDLSNNLHHIWFKNPIYNKKTPLLLCNTDNKNLIKHKHNIFKNYNNKYNMNCQKNVKQNTFINNFDKYKYSNYKYSSNLNNKDHIIDFIHYLDYQYEKNNTDKYKPLFFENYNKLPPIPPTIKIKNITIKTYINEVQDLIDLTIKYPILPNVKYNINMKAIHDIKQPLINLNNMIGMNTLKKDIINQILYFIQNFHINPTTNNNDFMHTCIYGPPGTGKTEIAKLLGCIYSNLGILNKKSFKKVTRTDLIAGYLGQTAIKTTNVINESLGGVLFIDEAYALGNNEKRDSFAKECIDTLCEALSNHKDKLMVIIAGYEKELNECFFNYNQGLNSRFTWRYKTDDYSHKELFLIFIKKIKDINWTIHKNIKNNWFLDKMKYFKYYGRDMETLLAKVKIAHSKRVFCLDNSIKKHITIDDMNNGFDFFINNDEVNNRNKASFLSHMYC
jgi:AAA+ superfamily predicted ATPase